MGETYIPAALRWEVIERAQHCCEYCDIRDTDRPIDFAIDRGIAEKHGGKTVTRIEERELLIALGVYPRA